MNLPSININGSASDTPEIFKNKTMDYGDVIGGNTLKCTPVTIEQDTTLTPTKELNVILGGTHTCLTLGNAPYSGYTLPITCSNIALYIKFKNVSGNICVISPHLRSTVVLSSLGDRWFISSGTHLDIEDDNTINNAPYINPADTSQGRYLPNDWRIRMSNAQLTFYYAGTQAQSAYGLPEKNCFVTVCCEGNARRVAYAQKWAKSGASPDAPRVWWSYLHDDVSPYEWEPWYQMTINNAVQTLTNKTIDAKNNIIRCERIIVSESISPTVADVSKTVSYKITGDHAVIKLPTPSDLYTGLQVKISGDMSNCGYVVFRDWIGGYQCISIVRAQTIYMTIIGGSWIPAQGSTFITYTDTVTNAPLNYEVPQDNPSYGQPYLVNSWKESKGIGMYSYTYDISQGVLYDVPGNSTVSVVFNQIRRGSATIIWTETKIMEFAACIDNVWSSKYRLTDTSSAQTLTNKTIDADNNTLKNVVTSKNITNCITAIPQDIKLELTSSSIITLKAGSKIWYPDGLVGSTPKFSSVTITNDVSLNISATSYSGESAIFYITTSNSLAFAATSTISSGTTDPGANTVWYDITNNNIRRNVSGTVTNGYSLPLALAHTSSGTFTSINQVFNGMGYIGSTIFALPGLKGLSPNGRNSDGSLNSGLRQTTQVTTLTSSSTRNNYLYFGTNAIFEGIPGTNYYDATDNYIRRVSDNAIVVTMPIATYTTTSGVISNFKPNTVFHAVDYNDWANHIGSGEVHDVTSSMTSNFETLGGSGQGIFWCMMNRVCYVTINAIRNIAATSATSTVVSGLPKAKMQVYSSWFNGEKGNALVFMSEDGTELRMGSNPTAASNCFVSFSYPVADDWVES